mgnify:FL=1|tara:strand:- start:184 stop:582 length:399 start_codon:yes stop_codon:yes gene_type:complete
MKRFKFYEVQSSRAFYSLVNRRDKGRLGTKMFFIFTSPWDTRSALLKARLQSLYGPAEDLEDFNGDKSYKTVLFIDSQVTPELFSLHKFSSLISITPSLMTVKTNSKVIVEDYLPSIYEQFFNKTEYDSLTV